MKKSDLFWMRHEQDWKPGKLAIPAGDYPPSYELAAREAAGVANKMIRDMLYSVLSE